MINNPEIYTLAFYNIENLFDTKNDPLTHDDDFLPNSLKRWTPKRYQKKLLKLGTVISKIGNENSNSAPDIIGLAEVENEKVVKDLVNSKNLIEENYSYIHYDSMDERGVDVALIYKSDRFQVINSETFSVYLENDKGEQDYTRDVLLVQGLLNNENINVIVNHWSSKREGEKETEFKRIAAANVVISIIKKLKEEKPEAKIIVMGDFNDNPNSKSILSLQEQGNLFNPFKTVWSRSNGSLNHNFQWNMFDQILFSTNFFDVSSSSLIYHNAEVFNSKFLTQYKGKFKGQPFRTFVGRKYTGGYSDHFPVFLQLKTS
ncbi:endonuclease/exonuclease/phosphatase family protein [uncultured Winogradskyella sp.]|uniref:endonuclease/exonuclease/phosphatase family protein n=1 Tax=Winogradskyella sp. 4-2091 TaxID=3381659 RepID=UPI0026361A43|nr:endonuclease/exonuclease/phosphatase family protein [uncultured Winogradskyella sp.]